MKSYEHVQYAENAKLEVRMILKDTGTWFK